MRGRSAGWVGRGREYGTKEEGRGRHGREVWRSKIIQCGRQIGEGIAQRG